MKQIKKLSDSEEITPFPFFMKKNDIKSFFMSKNIFDDSPPTKIYKLKIPIPKDKQKKAKIKK